MIDGIGGRLPLSPLRSGAATSTAPAAPTQAIGETRALQSGLSGIVSDLAASPPVDAAKVDRIKTALAAGAYPVQPARVAEAMIALDLPHG